MNGNQVNCDDLLEMLFRQTLGEEDFRGNCHHFNCVAVRESTEMTRNFSRLKVLTIVEIADDNFTWPLSSVAVA